MRAHLSSLIPPETETNTPFSEEEYEASRGFYSSKETSPVSGWVETGCKYRRKSPGTGGAEGLGLTCGKACSRAVLSSVPGMPVHGF